MTQKGGQKQRKEEEKERVQKKYPSPRLVKAPFMKQWRRRLQMRKVRLL